MNNPDPSIIANAVLADRALGAMFYSAFGGAWLALWAHREYADSLAVLGPVVAMTASLLAFAWYRYRRFRDGAVAIADSPQKKRADRLFHFVNAGQWIAILVAGNILANIGRSDWVIPAAMFIIGLHFLPLGKLFANPAHYVTGAALMVLSLAYPEYAAAGPADPIGCLGAGAILLTSGLWAVTANRFHTP